MEDILAVYFINHSTKRKTQEIKVRKKKEDGAIKCGGWMRSRR